MDEPWGKCRNLILVPAHAVFCGPLYSAATEDAQWVLQDFQKGEPPFYLEHIVRGVELASRDPQSLLIFSGGQTRLQAGPRSEALGYWLLADQWLHWKGTEVFLRATTEEFARDSFENLLFAICRFMECTSEYPRTIKVVGWKFKEQRFQLHRQTLQLSASRFEYSGVNDPADLEAALQGEKMALSLFSADPFGN